MNIRNLLFPPTSADLELRLQAVHAASEAVAEAASQRAGHVARAMTQLAVIHKEHTDEQRRAQNVRDRVARALRLSDLPDQN